MVIYDLHLACTVVPPENDSPLLVNSNRVIAGKIAFKGLEPIPRRSTQVQQALRRVQILQLPLSNLSQVRGETTGHAGLAIEEQVLRKLSPERDYHVIVL